MVCKLPLRELHRLWVEYDRGLLNDNIRLPAGTETPANKGMYETLCKEGPSEAISFFYYNNGITILCDKRHKPRTQRRNE